MVWGFRTFLWKSLEPIFLLAVCKIAANSCKNYKNSCKFGVGRPTKDITIQKKSCKIQSRHHIRGSCAIWSWSDIASWRTSSSREPRWFRWFWVWPKPDSHLIHGSLGRVRARIGASATRMKQPEDFSWSELLSECSAKVKIEDPDGLSGPDDAPRFSGVVLVK